MPPFVYYRERTEINEKDKYRIEILIFIYLFEWRNMKIGIFFSRVETLKEIWKRKVFFAGSTINLF